jgi:hypothetical protein
LGSDIVKGGCRHLCDRRDIVKKSDQSDAQGIFAFFQNMCSAQVSKAGTLIPARCRAAIRPQWQEVPPTRQLLPPRRSTDFACKPGGEEPLDHQNQSLTRA